MQSRVFIASLIAMLMFTACNLGGTSNPGEEDIPTADPQNAGQPQVTILSPTSGASFTVNEQILVSVSATDQIGVTRVQMFANGSLVKTVSSEFSDGEVSYEGVLDFTPRTDGDYNLRVIAFRNAISSPPAELQISVGEEQIFVTERSNSTGSSTGSIGNPVPIIPNDGVCRVLTLVGLNMRTQPTTTRDNVIRTFADNTLLNVVARLADNSWWKVSSGTTVGWVSGNPQFVSLSGNCSTIPIENVVLNTPTPSPTFLPPTSTPLPPPTNTAIPGVPDLIVPNIAIDAIIEIPNGETEITVEVTITVKNDGNAETGQFDVILTIERNGFDDVIYDVATVGTLDPGAIVTLTQDVVFDAADDYDVQVDADPDNDITESGEFNNRADTTIEVINAP